MKFLTVALGALLLLLTPLAHGSPVDPGIPGFWDDGDYDDVVLLVCATAAAVHSAPPAPDSRRVLVGTVPTADPGAPPFRAVAAVATRAPPRV